MGKFYIIIMLIDVILVPFWEDLLLRGEASEPVSSFGCRYLSCAVLGHADVSEKPCAFLGLNPDP